MIKGLRERLSSFFDMTVYPDQLVDEIFKRDFSVVTEEGEDYDSILVSETLEAWNEDELKVQQFADNIYRQAAGTDIGFLVLCKEIETQYNLQARNFTSGYLEDGDIGFGESYAADTLVSTRSERVSDLLGQLLRGTYQNYRGSQAYVTAQTQATSTLVQYGRHIAPMWKDAYEVTNSYTYSREWNEKTARVFNNASIGTAFEGLVTSNIPHKLSNTRKI